MIERPANKDLFAVLKSISAEFRGQWWKRMTWEKCICLLCHLFDDTNTVVKQQTSESCFCLTLVCKVKFI
jgi:hypothetical protein